MKKAIVYIFAALIALNALAGCGMEGDRNTTTNPSATPVVTTPDVNNGIVDDKDGIITDDDNGRVGGDKDTHNGDTGINGGAGTNNGTDTHTPGASSASPSPEAESTHNANGAKK